LLTKLKTRNAQQKLRFEIIPNCTKLAKDTRKKMDRKTAYTIFDAPLPRISLYCKNNADFIQFNYQDSHEKKDKNREKKNTHTLPYLPVGSTSTYKEESLDS